MKISIEHKLSHGEALIADVFHESESHYDVDACVDFAPVAGTPYFLVYAVHGSGDSFNPTKPQWVEIVDLFDAADKAVQLKDAIWEHHKRYEESYNLPYGYYDKKKGQQRPEPMTYEEASRLDFQGKTYYTPWNGHFEALYEVDIKVVYFAGKRYKF